MVNPTPLTFKWAEDDSEGTALSLAALEEQIIGEGPETIAAIMAESVVGSGGVFVHPPGYMQGVRALCDRYGTPPRNSGAQFWRAIPARIRHNSLTRRRPLTQASSSSWTK